MDMGVQMYTQYFLQQNYSYHVLHMYMLVFETNKCVNLNPNTQK
jgi:hypothetical protein